MTRQNILDNEIALVLKNEIMSNIKMLMVFYLSISISFGGHNLNKDSDLGYELSYKLYEYTKLETKRRVHLVYDCFLAICYKLLFLI